MLLGGRPGSTPSPVNAVHFPALQLQLQQSHDGPKSLCLFSTCMSCLMPCNRLKCNSLEDQLGENEKPHSPYIFIHLFVCLFYTMNSSGAWCSKLPKMLSSSPALKKREYLALCLWPSAKIPVFYFLLKLIIFCAFTTFERGKKP